MDESALPQPALLVLPDELLMAIVRHLNPVEVLSFGQSCGRTKSVTDSPSMWRNFCLETWNNWNPEHEIAAKTSGPPEATDWQGLFIQRMRWDRETLDIYNKMLSSQRLRYKRMDYITSLGYDAVDLLMKMKCQTPDSADDVLARRWHAGSLLGQIRRRTALGIWTMLAHGSEVKLEQSLGAFDLFVHSGEHTDLSPLSHELDSIARDVKGKLENFDGLSTRKKAIEIARLLREYNYTGMDEGTQERDYHALQNNFLATALREHSSLPLQSVAIYCAVAERLGLDAKPSNYPGHVHAVIQAPAGETLDGGVGGAIPESGSTFMYMDPWRHSDEVPEELLRFQLLHMGIAEVDHESHFGPTSVAEITLRTARNIMQSVEQGRHGITTPARHLDLEAAWYAMLWVLIILGDNNNMRGLAQRRAILRHLIEHFQVHFPEDISLMDSLTGLFSGEAEYHILEEIAESARAADRAVRIASPRNAQNASVSYKIGHHFRHKRFGYEGFIVGWHPRCNAGLRWIEQMRVDDLPRGREQPFYNIVADDKSTRYVADENIELVHRRPTEKLMDLAGRYFKRWNQEEGKFESNIRDEFPDD